jgi:hypothetical protein
MKHVPEKTQQKLQRREPNLEEIILTKFLGREKET